MIISRYLTKEILNTLLAVTFVLLLIFLSNQLVRYLSYAAAGKLGANILFQLMGFEIPYLLALLLPLSLYLGIILAYGRMYAESEMRVLHACGLSVKKLIGMTSAITLVTASVVFMLTLWVNPWLSSEKEKLIARSISTDNLLDTIMPGRFKVSSDGKRVVYVESVKRGYKQANNVFIADQGAKAADGNGAAWTIVSADKGSQWTDKATQDRFLVASDGYRYEGKAGQNDFKIIQFKKYAIRIPYSTATSKRQEQESIPTNTLFKNYKKSEHAAELQWRFSIPLSVLLLGLLAIPFSHVGPRQSRYSQLIPAILIYIVYINLLFVARNWVELGFLPTWIGMWWVHLIVLSLATILLISQAGWKQFMRRSS